MFTGHLTGSAGIYFSANGLIGSSATLAVITEPSVTVANGSGSITGFAIQRDASGNFIANVPASWSLKQVQGEDMKSDLVWR